MKNENLFTPMDISGHLSELEFNRICRSHQQNIRSLQTAIPSLLQRIYDSENQPCQHTLPDLKNIRFVKVRELARLIYPGNDRLFASTIQELEQRLLNVLHSGIRYIRAVQLTRNKKDMETFITIHEEVNRSLTNLLFPNIYFWAEYLEKRLLTLKNCVLLHEQKTTSEDSRTGNHLHLLNMIYPHTGKNLTQDALSFLERDFTQSVIDYCTDLILEKKPEKQWDWFSHQQLNCCILLLLVLRHLYHALISVNLETPLHPYHPDMNRIERQQHLIQVAEKLYEEKLLNTPYQFAALLKIIKEMNLLDRLSTQNFLELMNMSRIPAKVIPCASTLRNYIIHGGNYPNWKTDLRTEKRQIMLKLVERFKQIF